jgi:hypothetical protein
MPKYHFVSILVKAKNYKSENYNVQIIEFEDGDIAVNISRFNRYVSNPQQSSYVTVSEYIETYSGKVPEDKFETALYVSAFRFVEAVNCLYSESENEDRQSKIEYLCQISKLSVAHKLWDIAGEYCELSIFEACLSARFGAKIVYSANVEALVLPNGLEVSCKIEGSQVIAIDGKDGMDDLAEYF